MGIAFNSQISTNITESYLNIITTITNSAASSNFTTASNNNSLNVQICPPSCQGACTINGNVSINQKNTAQVTSTTTTLQNVVDTVKSQIASQTTTFVKQASSAEQSWLSTAFGINVNVQTTIDRVSEIINNSISSDASSVCRTDVINDNSINLQICGNINGSLLTNQSNAAIAASSCITKQMIKNLLSNTEFVQGMITADQQATVNQGGPFDFLYWILVFFAFIIFIVVIAGIIRYLTRSPKPPKTQPLQPLQPAQNVNNSTTNIPNSTRQSVTQSSIPTRQYATQSTIPVRQYENRYATVPQVSSGSNVRWRVTPSQAVRELKMVPL
jgi:hypothetical protein